MPGNGDAATGNDIRLPSPAARPRRARAPPAGSPLMRAALARLAGLAAMFLRWWGRELAGLVPASLRRLAERRPPVIVIDVAGEGLAVGQWSDGVFREVAAAGNGVSERALRDQIERRAGRRTVKQAQVVLRLPPDKALYKSLLLPAMAEDELASALYYQIDRQTPFASSDVYFDYRVREARDDGKRLAVDLVVVPKAVVDPLRRRLAGLGLAPAAIDVRRAGRDARPEFNLLRSAEPVSASRTVVFVNGALALAAIVLLAVAVYVPLDQRRAVSDDLSGRLAFLRKEADAVVRLQAEIERLRNEAGLVERQKHAQAPVTIVFEELSRRLPDHTWVTEIQINGPTVRLSGYSSASSSLIALLDESPTFKTPRFNSPVTSDPETGQERFNLSIDLENARSE
jgi:general secretion pathway protein L